MQLSRWLAALPTPLDDLEEGGSVLSGNTLFIYGESAKRPIRFIGIEQKGVRFGHQEQLVSNDNSFRILIPIYLDFSAIEGSVLIVEGILMFGRKSDDPSYVVQLIVDSSSNWSPFTPLPTESHPQHYPMIDSSSNLYEGKAN